MIEMLNEWTSLPEDGKCVDAIHFDFTKAFDKVPHVNLLRILKMALDAYAASVSVLMEYSTMMFVTAADLSYMIVIMTCGILSISANLFLLYMITRKSPPHLTPYRIFLGNTALTQLLYSFVMLTIQPRLILHDMNIVVIYLGPAQYLGPWACYMLYIGVINMDFVSDVQSNNIYTNYTVPHLDKYETAVGAKIEQVRMTEAEYLSASKCNVN
ncbi:hypothetical protein OESDEN_07627 [Oesophagostomum dentatum]|uniref:7TM GPCR serpentine receptor class x (Srx) domain-containing protein n=1 Tax=Oesophagostomum dentatum TaxID=61180 RepID=A0A0B1T5G7_OESDE|nr:hypothetical protein OESDEN_07627 [Oesophagostomum dentatum]